MKTERFARLLVIVIAIGLPAMVVVARSASDNSIELHAQMADTGGWMPGTLTALAGQPINLRLTSDDVLHGFAIGQSNLPSVDVLPGQWTTTTLIFDRPGKYTFYCTRWCGPNHWRMRGTIEITGAVIKTVTETVPLYIGLKLDLDAPHPSDVVPAEKPSAARGAALNVETVIAADAYQTQSPAQVWQRLRQQASLKILTDQQVWDLVATLWRTNTMPDRLAEGQKLYAANCAACHGETGKGDGVMATLSATSLQKSASSDMPGMIGHDTVKPIDFTNAQTMLGANSAILQGKIVRGGMGTGMPYWGSIFTDAQIWALIDYLWTFQFD